MYKFFINFITYVINIDTFNFRVSLHANIKPALAKLHNTISIVTSQRSSDIRVIVSRMNLVDLNKALYRCDQEERDETSNRFDVYDIPGYGPLVYAGLQGKLTI